MEHLDQISELLQRGKAKEVKELVQEAIEKGYDAKTILEKGLLMGMGIIGEKFKKNEIFVPEVLVAARAMNMGIDVLNPLLISSGVKARGTIVLGTVKGDLHDIGKNLVGMMMKGKGFKVIDLGTDVPAERFIKKAQEEKADIIGCSALLTTTMNQMKEVVTALKESGLRDNIKIMVGGAPITESFCKAIGADLYAPDAASAADAAMQLFENQP